MGGRIKPKSLIGSLRNTQKLWQAADNFRGHMDAAEYKHVVLGLIFLKYISDAFGEKHEQLEVVTADPDSDYCLKEPVSPRYSLAVRGN
jgi:type I restriction-modification system DNA methylase subunit